MSNSTGGDGLGSSDHNFEGEIGPYTFKDEIRRLAMLLDQARYEARSIRQDYPDEARAILCDLRTVAGVMKTYRDLLLNDS